MNRGEFVIDRIPKPLVFTVVVFNLLTTFGAFAGTAPADVHPWVLAHTAEGAEAEFFVVLRDQADLSQSEALETKADKGRFVRNALWATAERTPGPPAGVARAARDLAPPLLHRQRHSRPR